MTENTTTKDTAETVWTQEDIDEVTIEASVLVHLNWDAENRRWVVAPSTMDGHPLDSHGGSDGEGPIYTDFGGYDGLPPQKREEWDQAAQAGMPNGSRLIGLLQEVEHHPF